MTTPLARHVIEPTKAAKQDPFEVWLMERPKWLQTAAAVLLRNQRLPTQTEMVTLADLCTNNALNVEGVKYEPVPAGAFSQNVATLALRIDALDALTGVNAIQLNASLTFGKGNLAVIYGCNGVGKSGYARLLKHICGARIKGDLHSNIFADIEVIPSATVHITSQTSKTLPWSATTGPLTELKHVHIFDNQTSLNYVNIDNEATYEPRRMRFLSTLIGICDGVADVLETRKAQYIKGFPQIPAEYIGTPSHVFVAGLKPGITQKQISEACVFTAEQAAEKVKFEALLKLTDYTDRQRAFAQYGQRVVLLKAEFAAFKLAFGDGAFNELIILRQDALVKRRAASEDAKTVFADAPLTGVGQSTWRLMWDQARQYSMEQAYPGNPFPVTSDDAHCVLCQQPLSDDARQRLDRFQAYVTQGLERQANAAETALDKRIKVFPRLPAAADWDTKLEILEINVDAGRTIYAALTSRLASISAILSLDELVAPDWELLDRAVVAAEEQLKKDLAALAALQEASKRTEMERQLKQLRAAEWISQNKGAIETEVTRLKKIKNIDTAARVVKPNALTIKKNELAEEELANGYQDRFKAELAALGGTRLPVKPVAHARGKGRISFELHLVNAKRRRPVHEILSEGEIRIVALAAFLADLTGSGQPTPFVFDDPISSLDQDFEERVVARLVELAKTRQVIVFTHRLSLLAILEDALAQSNTVAKDTGSAPIEYDVLGLRRIGPHIGMMADLNVRDKNPKSALNKLRDHAIPRLRKLAINNDAEGYDRETKAVCSDFRILVERVIEHTLLNDVIGRFRRSIKTMGKLGGLAVIEKEDCHMLDELMTHYSRYEHSQSAELPGVAPTPDELNEHVGKVITWIDGITKRRTT